MSESRKKDNKFLFKKRELIFFVISIILVLLLFSLTRNLLDIAKKEEKHIHLTISYLENIIRREPGNYDAKMTLVQRYLEHGYFAKAEKLIEDIERSNLDKLKEKAIFLRYDLVKKKAFSYPEGSSERESTLEEAKKLLGNIVLLNKDPKLLSYLYNESHSMNLPEVAFSVVQNGLTFEGTERIYWLKEGHKTALMISRYEEALKYAMELSELDRNNRFHWRIKAGDTALSAGKYKESADIYISALKEENDKQRRKDLIRKAISSLLAGKKYVEARNIIRKFYSEFIYDADTIKFFIQTALSANDIRLAREISIKVMRGLF